MSELAEARKLLQESMTFLAKGKQTQAKVTACQGVKTLGYGRQFLDVFGHYDTAADAVQGLQDVIAEVEQSIVSPQVVPDAERLSTDTPPLVRAIEDGLKALIAIFLIAAGILAIAKVAGADVSAWCPPIVCSSTEETRR